MADGNITDDMSNRFDLGYGNHRMKMMYISKSKQVRERRSDIKQLDSGAARAPCVPVTRDRQGSITPSYRLTDGSTPDRTSLFLSPHNTPVTLFLDFWVVFPLSKN